MSTPVELYVYDLSNGMARSMSLQLTGKYIEGIWHTSVVVFGQEVFFGQGISVTRPGGSHHGQPMKKLSMGTTNIDQETFQEYLTGLRDLYKAEAYHLLEFNCNTFTNDVVNFLCGRSIPQDIIDLPNEFLRTPFGQSMRPMIEQMFRETNAAAAPSANEAASMLQNAAVRQPQNGTASTSVTSGLTICTNLSSFNSLLNSKECLVVMFTRENCPPCRTIKPVFEDLAIQHSHAERRQRTSSAKESSKSIAFAIVDTTHAESQSIASRFSITATPTFLFFHRGQQTHELKGANQHELKTQVDLLLHTAYPPHSHRQQYQPSLRALSKASINYSSKPNMTAALTKISSALDAKGTPEATKTKHFFAQTVVPLLSKEGTTASISADRVTQWISANAFVFDNIPQSDWFPVIDLLRVANLTPQLASSLLPSLKTCLNKVAAPIDQAETIPKATLITALKLFTNAAPLVMWEHRAQLTRLAIDGLLHVEASVRTPAASLIFRMAQLEFERRVDWVQTASEEDEADEGWEIECLSAVLESLAQETSVDVVHRLIASLGLLLYYSAHLESLGPLVEALEGSSRLKSKGVLLKDEAGQRLVKQVQALIGN